MLPPQNGTYFYPPRMAGMADARPPFDDRPDFGRGGRVAALSQDTATSTSPRYFLPIIILWITISVFQLILVRLLPTATWLGAVQVLCDVCMITGIVYSTGMQDSVLHLSLFAGHHCCQHSVFAARRVLTAASCILALALVNFLADTGRIPRTSITSLSAESLRLWFLSNAFGFLAVAYLASLLSLSLRRKSTELEQKREELLDLQDFTRRHHPFDARRACDDRS